MYMHACVYIYTLYNLHIYIYIYYIYIYISDPRHTECSSCTPYIVHRTSCAQVHELPQSHCGDNREGTLFS